MFMKRIYPISNRIFSPGRDICVTSHFRVKPPPLLTASKLKKEKQEERERDFYDDARSVLFAVGVVVVFFSVDFDAGARFYSQ